MASPGGSDRASRGEHLQPSGSSSSSRSISSFASGDSCSTSRSSSSATEPTCLTIQLLEEITDNFSEERALGQGSYGKVYKGIHENGEEIAVKLLYNSIQSIDDEKFQHEFRNLRILDHKNTVRLVGYCYETRRQHMELEGEIVFVEKTYKALCFEYMQMGSLQRHISDENLGLDWRTRYKIIKGTCEGLKYLHEGLKEPIYHLDLKPDNILLDKNMVPKLADFGLSKLFGEDQTRITQNSIGTIGYMPPEYILGNVISKKFDIFSLGVIITKIISGPSGRTRCAEMPCQEFLDQVNENWRNRLQTECTSQTLEANCEQVSICTEIGRRCMDEDRHKRPSIVDIIHILDVTETMIEKGTTLGGLLSNITLQGSSCSEGVARSFCRQTVDNALISVDSHEDYQLLKAQESPRRFRDMSDKLMESIIYMYDRETKKYDPKVRDNERQYMVEKLRKVIIEDSRILIRRMLRKASEQFKREYAANLKSMEETDMELNYDYQMVDSCVEEFRNSCNDLKLFDSDYLHMKQGELQKHLHLYTVHQILTIKEIRWRKATELAQDNLEEVQTRLKKAIQQRGHTEAEMAKQQEEYTLKMLAKQQEEMEKKLAAEHQEIQWRKSTELAQQRFENSLEEVQTRLEEVIQQRQHREAEMAKQQEEYTLKMLAKQQEQEIRARKQVAELQKTLEETTEAKQNAEADAEMMRQYKEELEDELERTRGVLAEQEKRAEEGIRRLERKLRNVELGLQCTQEKVSLKPKNADDEMKRLNLEMLEELGAKRRSMLRELLTAL